MYTSLENRLSSPEGHPTPSFRAETPQFDIVVVAASAGGIPALNLLLSTVPEHFPVPIVIVQHLCHPSRYVSVLDEVLRHATRLHVKWATDGERPEKGTIYLAPQDRHTTIQKDGRLQVFWGEKINLFRPAADPLFFSAAQCYGNRTLAIVLSGGSSDGSDGAADLVSVGATVLVQDAESSMHSYMPKSTMRKCKIRSGFTPESLGLLLASLVLGSRISFDSATAAMSA